ncbi:hypothetical protein ILUMI_17880 [Ignelater luminosus]|uniref:Uncharacterized protein n=1 Tax=Ignelater luminosus TaxID=2038154 RepID=A0A8K0CMG9_IGNLU|nr:hypothetical protein ILUMI_17880 [Ignelater luminosus]
MTAFNKEEVTLFFKNLEDIMEKHQFTASKIYNKDESGIRTVQDHGIMIAEKRQKRVGLQAMEGKEYNCHCSVSAAGSYIPPIFIQARQCHLGCPKMVQLKLLTIAPKMVGQITAICDMAQTLCEVCKIVFG